MLNSRKTYTAALLAGGCAVAAAFLFTTTALTSDKSADAGDQTRSVGADHAQLIQAANAVDQKRPVSFNRDIRPILAENCYGCHGPDTHAAEADLSLHSFEAATVVLYDDVHAIKPGDPESSEAWLRIIDRTDPMPPKKSHKVLTDEQKELIRLWIEQGAEYQPHWAYVKPEMSEAPQVSNPAWSDHWIDRYLMKNWEEEGLKPVGDASKTELIRRLSFDLTGLPPTPDEVEAFLNDDSSEAYEKIVDRLLASPSFGERMAIYWLDVVRFADTVGYHGDQTMSITPYRDWVIWAFNENLPYSKFIRHQVAGDLVDDPEGHAIIASAYNRLYQTSHEGGIQRKEYEVIYDADRVRNFSEAFMGATIGCAQCHDHKYDPFTDEDFYSLAAFFGQIDDLWHLPGEDGKFSKAGNTNPTNRHPEIEVLSPLDEQRKSELQAKLKEADDAEQRQVIQREIDAIKPRRVMISKQAQTPRPVRFLNRGDWQDTTGPVMQPAIPSFMGELEVTDGTPDRLDLANWLVTPMAEGGSGELTARVMVNRLWYLVYGEGLTPSLGDFGGQGIPPNHPELLDRLAIQFVDSGWDVKAILKQMVSARAYRLSTQATAELLRDDPNNEFFARQSQTRLPAEMIRDNALLVSGLLINQLGGESARPYQPADYYAHLNFPTRKYKQHNDLNQWRRGVYVHWQRQFLHPMLKAFDAPTREECTAKRSVSNTPLAALVLLNDPTFVEASRSFAQRVMFEAQGSDRERLNWAMQQALSRDATPAEAEIMLDLLETNRKEFADQPASASLLLSVGLTKPQEGLDPVELAAWSEICRLILNLHETITRP